MSTPTKQSPFVYPRTAVGFPEKLVIAATAVITLQVLLAVVGVAPLKNWFAWIFVISGLASFFGSIALIIWRRSGVWGLALALSLFDWFVAFAVAFGAGIARMH